VSAQRRNAPFVRRTGRGGRIQVDQLLEGYRPGRIVRIYPGNWPVIPLPLEESLRARVLSARGIAVAWISYDQFGERTVYEPTGPADPIFYLRRPGGSAAHIWRLFRTKPEARVYMAEYYGRDSEGRDWAETLPAETFDELLARHRAG